MKLDQRKIHWIIRQKQKGVTTKQIALDMKISRRRVQQIWKSYAESKQEPAIGENMGRPRKPFDERESEVVSEGYRLYRFGARMLEVAVRKCLRSASPITAFTCISKQRAWLMKIRRNRRRRKWIRYERKHYSGSAEGHGYPNLQVGEEVNPRPDLMFS